LFHVLVTEMGFRLVSGFINHLQVVTTINYNTVPNFYATKHSTLISSVSLHCSSQLYHTWAIQVSLNHTPPISLYYNTHAVVKSHVRCSQADLLCSSALLVSICSLLCMLLPWLLFTCNCQELILSLTFAVTHCTLFIAASHSWDSSASIPTALPAGNSLTTEHNLIFSLWFLVYNLWSDTQKTLLPTVLLMLHTHPFHMFTAVH
jgi:hypothetical protein